MTDQRDLIAALRDQLDQKFKARKAELDAMEARLTEIQRELNGEPEADSNPAAAVAMKRRGRPPKPAVANEGKLKIGKAVRQVLENAHEPLSTREIADRIDESKIKALPKTKNLPRAVAGVIFYLKTVKRITEGPAGKYRLADR